MTTPLRRRTAAVASLLLVPLLAACGFNIQTDQQYQAATGVDDRSGTVDVLNALIVSAEQGRGTFAGTLVNTSTTATDRLVSVTDATLAKPIKIAPEGVVNLAADGAVQIENDSVKSGSMVRVTLQFESGQTTNMLIPVVPDREDYAGVPTDAATAATE